MNESEQVADTEIVRAFLERTAHLSDPEAAEAAGVTHTTIGRWKQGYGEGWKTLHASTRRKLLDYLERVGEERPENAHRAADSDLQRRMDEIEAMDAPELVKLVKLEAVSAAIRAEAARLEAHAAAMRAAAIERAEMSAADRAVAIRQAEESAQDRTRALRHKERPEWPEDLDELLSLVRRGMEPKSVGAEEEGRRATDGRG